jgi:hypothetical protein
MSEKRKIVLSEVLSLLKDGKSRKEINIIYELNPLEVKALWGNEKLKNKKPAKYTINFDLDDDIEIDYGILPKSMNPSANIISK